MRRPRIFTVPLTLAALIALNGAWPAAAADGDVMGASDYPGIERFAGSVITGYDAKESARTRLQTAPFALGDATGDHRPEGRVTRIAYRTGPGVAMADVSRAFEAELAQAGYAPVFTCEAEICGGVNFSLGVDVMFVPAMWVNGVNYHYFVGRKGSEAGGETWASVLVSHHLDFVTAQLVVTEVGAGKVQ